jgi:hypothetical protein
VCGGLDGFELRHHRRRGCHAGINQQSAGGVGRDVIYWLRSVHWRNSHYRLEMDCRQPSDNGGSDRNVSQRRVQPGSHRVRSAWLQLHRKARGRKDEMSLASICCMTPRFTHASFNYHCSMRSRSWHRAGFNAVVVVYRPSSRSHSLTASAIVYSGWLRSQHHLLSSGI